MGNLGIKLAKVACLSSPDPSSYSLSDILLLPSQFLDERENFHSGKIVCGLIYNTKYELVFFLFFVNEITKIRLELFLYLRIRFSKSNTNTLPLNI